MSTSTYLRKMSVASSTSSFGSGAPMVDGVQPASTKHGVFHRTKSSQTKSKRLRKMTIERSAKLRDKAKNSKRRMVSKDRASISLPSKMHQISSENAASNGVERLYDFHFLSDDHYRHPSHQIHSASKTGDFEFAKLPPTHDFPIAFWNQFPAEANNPLCVAIQAATSKTPEWLFHEGFGETRLGGGGGGGSQPSTTGSHGFSTVVTAGPSSSLFGYDREEFSGGISWC